MSNNQIEDDKIIEKTNFQKKKMGLDRHFTQIIDTIHFEFKRYYKITIILAIVFFLIFLLNLITNEIQEIQGVEVTEDSIDYISSYLNMLDLLIIISTVTYGGSIIAEDFQKQTGNLLFPKIKKSRLLIGRIISRYTLNATLVCFYYILVASITYYKYEEVPQVLFESMDWALLYTFMLFSFVIFMSSFNKSVASSIIISIIFLLMVFNMIINILVFTRITIEPLFIITYYENIITASLDMPDPRYEDVSRPSRREGQTVEFRRWLTPSKIDAILGMSLFSSLFLIVAYIFFRMRQSKSE